MTAHPAVQRVGRFHRRMVVALAAKYAGVGVATGAVIASAGVAGAIPSLLLGGLVGLLAGLVRAPDLLRVAGEVDRSHGLQDRLRTALDLRAQTDPMSQLVLDDAWQRVRALDPARVAPLRLGVPAAWLLAALVIVAAPGRWLPPEMTADRPGGTAGSASSEAATESAADAPEPSSGSSGGGSESARQTDARQAAVDEGTPASGSSAAPGGDGYLPAAEGESAGANARSIAGEIADASTGSVEGQDGPAAAAAAGRDRLSGGMASGAASESHVEPSSGAAAPRMTKGNAQLLRQAESALARDGVPPGLRRYVMAYLQAVSR